MKVVPWDIALSLESNVLGDLQEHHYLTFDLTSSTKDLTPGSLQQPTMSLPDLASKRALLKAFEFGIFKA